MIVSNNEKMGVTFEGTEGKIYVNRGKLEAEPAAILDSKIGPEGIHLYKSDDHFRNFIDCVISRGPTAAPVEVAHRSITICHLGNIAMRLKREKLRWDPRTEQIVGDDEAARCSAAPTGGPGPLLDGLCDVNWQISKHSRSGNENYSGIRGGFPCGPGSRRNSYTSRQVQILTRFASER